MLRGRLLGQPGLLRSALVQFSSPTPSSSRSSIRRQLARLGAAGVVRLVRAVRLRLPEPLTFVRQCRLQLPGGSFATASSRANRPLLGRRRGEVVLRENNYAWWFERFTAEECAAMARAIWGREASGPARTGPP